MEPIRTSQTDVFLSPDYAVSLEQLHMRLIVFKNLSFALSYVDTMILIILSNVDMALNED